MTTTINNTTALELLQNITTAPTAIIKSDLLVVAPEITIIIVACMVLLLDLGKTKKPNFIYLIAQLGLLLSTYITVVVLGLGKTFAFHGAYISDNFANISKIFLYLISSTILIYSRKYLAVRNYLTGEFLALILFSLSGMMVLISSSSLLTLYLGVELFALPLYALIAYRKYQLPQFESNIKLQEINSQAANQSGIEAALKYFILGGIASGLFLYGISLVYGTTGTFDITTICSNLENVAAPVANLVNINNVTNDAVNIHGMGLQSNYLLLPFGIMFILTGVAFKLGAVPFHLWVPDTYQGSNTTVTLIISTIAKLAGLGMAVRVLSDAFYNYAQVWQPLLLIMAVLSLFIGNLAAIMQTNLKRLLAYSTISHIGFICLALLMLPDYGITNAIFYTIIYALTTLAAFGVMLALSKDGFEADNIVDFKGLGYTHPVLALIMLLVIFSLAGIPPLAGFYAKFLILKNLVIFKPFGMYLTIFALIMSVIAGYYYLRIIKVMYFEQPQSQLQPQSQPKIQQNLPNTIYKYNNADNNTIGMHYSGIIILSINAIILLLLGIFPTLILNLCMKSL